MRLVILESPLAAGHITLHRRHIAYAKACMLDCLRRGESPLASHLLYPQVLDDQDAADRALGIAAGLAWGLKADATVLYADFGVSDGMLEGMRAAWAAGRDIEHRSLDKAILDRISSMD